MRHTNAIRFRDILVTFSMTIGLSFKLEKVVENRKFPFYIVPLIGKGKMGIGAFFFN